MKYTSNSRFWGRTEQNTVHYTVSQALIFIRIYFLVMAWNYIVQTAIYRHAEHLPTMNKFCSGTGLSYIKNAHTLPRFDGQFKSINGSSACGWIVQLVT